MWVSGITHPIRPAMKEYPHVYATEMGLGCLILVLADYHNFRFAKTRVLDILHFL
jgi:hypothetical protein